MPDMLKSAVSFLKQYGYLSEEHAASVRSFEDVALTSALAKYQRFDANVERFKSETGEPLLHDGGIGPATLMSMSIPRCGHPDVGLSVELPALGQGGWQDCHGQNGAHCAVAHVDYTNFPSFLKGDVWKRVLRNTRKAYADIGLLWWFIDSDYRCQISGVDARDYGVRQANTNITFTRGNGWIGLAIVGTGQRGNQSCSSRIWAQFDYRYRGGSSTDAIINQWTTLVMHELGHNCSLQHSRGGVMNPGIINGLPMDWDGDPHEGTLRRLFGGEPVDIPNDDPRPPEPPQPPDGDWPPKYGESLGVATIRLVDGTVGVADIRRGM